MICELCQFEIAQQEDFEERILWLLIGEWVQEFGVISVAANLSRTGTISLGWDP